MNTDALLRAVDAKRAPLFRFPYGARNAEGLQLLNEAGLKSIMWNIDSMDWADPVPESIVQRVVDQVQKEQRGIILFHDIHDRAVKALPQILDKLIADGVDQQVARTELLKVVRGQPHDLIGLIRSTKDGAGD